jgi:hypothetical protein
MVWEVVVGVSEQGGEGGGEPLLIVVTPIRPRSVPRGCLASCKIVKNRREKEKRKGAVRLQMQI